MAIGLVQWIDDLHPGYSAQAAPNAGTLWRNGLEPCGSQLPLQRGDRSRGSSPLPNTPKPAAQRRTTSSAIFVC